MVRVFGSVQLVKVLVDFVWVESRAWIVRSPAGQYNAGQYIAVKGLFVQWPFMPRPLLPFFGWPQEKAAVDTCDQKQLSADGIFTTLLYRKAVNGDA
jgi:hypothetical protein